MSVIVAIKSENVIYMGCDTQTTSGKDKENKLQESTFKISKLRSGMLVGICGKVAAHQSVCDDESVFEIENGELTKKEIVNNIIPKIKAKLKDIAGDTSENERMPISIILAYKDKLFERWFEGNKSFNLRQLKIALPEYKDEIDELDKKTYKDIVFHCCEPINNFFSEFGNDVIALCNNIINDKVKDDVVMTLRKDLRDIVKDIQSGDNEELNAKLSLQLNKLERLGNKINPTEGIVFRVGDQIMKLTGSFGVLNQILGSIKFSR